MPMAMATCWLSATARMAMPFRDFRKNQPKPVRNSRLTTAPSSWMGGMNSGPRTNGSSEMGSGSVLVPAPRVDGPMPRRIAASPMRMPLESSRRRKPRSSDTGGRSLDVLDLDPRLDGGLPAVLVGDGRGQLDLVLARVERVDHRSVFLGDEAPPHLARARDLGVVGLQVLGEEEEALDARGLGQRRVPPGDLLADQLADLGLLAQVHVA